MLHIQLELHHNNPPNFSLPAKNKDSTRTIESGSGPSFQTQPLSNESWAHSYVRECELCLPCHLLNRKQLLKFTLYEE